MTETSRFPYQTQKGAVPFAYSIENSEGLSRTAAVELDAAAMDVRFAAKVQEYRTQVRLPGFRQGKVPANVIRQRFSKGIEGEVLEALIKEVYPEVLRREENVAGVLNVEPVMDDGKPQLAEDGAYQFKIVFEVGPDVKLKKVKKLSITAPESKVEDKDIDEVLDRVRKERSEFVNVDKKAAMGDFVDIEYRMLEGDVPADDKPSTFFWELGEKGIHEGIDQALVGSAKGEDVTVTVTFAEDVSRKDFAGRTIEFAIHILRVAEQKIPELDDEFAKALGQFENVDALRERVRESISQEREQQTTDVVRRGLLAELRAANPVELPASFVERLQQNRAARMMQSMKQQGMMKDGDEKQYAGFVYNAVKAEAESEGHDQYLLKQIADDNGFEVSEEELNEELGKMAASYQMDVPQLRNEIGSDGIEGVQEGMRAEKAFEFVKENAKIEYITVEAWTELQQKEQQGEQQST